MLKKIFLHREKDQTKNFSPFLCKRPFDHQKEFLKSSQIHFKEFHLKATSNGSFNKVWWKSRNHTEIRNPSEAYFFYFFLFYATSCFPPFHSPGFTESSFFRAQVFQGPDFSESRFFRAQVFQDPGFSGSGSRVWVQVLEVAQKDAH